MSIKIHHGPNGAYKTSGAIQDDAVPALLEGRVVITNVRGFTLERVLQVYPDLPATVDIINLNLQNLADLERMRTWFQWAPRGAFIILDETQLVFPKAWREKDLDRFNFPGGIEAADEADRPSCWLDGWTRHRHWNWDIVLTTPNISYIRDDIRMTCEMAYKHSNLAVIGVRGRYKEAQHDAQLNRAPVEGTIVEYKRIKPDTFRLYDSTATGKTQDTKAGKSLFKSPKLLVLLAFIAVLLVAALSLGGPQFGVVAAHKDDLVSSAPVPAAPAGAPAAVHPAAGSPVRIDPLGVVKGDSPPARVDHPFANLQIALVAVAEGKKDGKFWRRALFRLSDGNGRSFIQSSDELSALGYLVGLRGSCFAVLRYRDWEGSAVCSGRASEQAPGVDGVALMRASDRSNKADTPPISSPQSLPSLPVQSAEYVPDRTALIVVPDSEYPSRPWR